MDEPSEAHPEVLEAPTNGDAAAGGTPIQHPSILVMRVPGEQPGQEQLQIAEMNGMDALAVPTVLRLAAEIREQQLGLK